MSDIKMDNNWLPEVLRENCPYYYHLCDGAFDCPCACGFETCADSDECRKNAEPDI